MLAGFDTRKKVRAPLGVKKVNAVVGWTLFSNAWLDECDHSYLVLH